MTNLFMLILMLALAALPGAAEDKDTSLMKSATVGNGGTGTTEKNLYQDSIQAAKQSIARETLDAFYHDALDYYHDGHDEDALQLLDKIYSIDPHYEDVPRLRETIRRRIQSSQTETMLSSVKEWMKKGEKAEASGQRVLAISYWKQALFLNPGYAPAQRKIDDANRLLAKKEFETGYLHYHRAELEDALDSWSNAVALDPSYKQRGLLLLMSKVELQVRSDRIARLAAQGFEQYQQGQLENALGTYQELTKLEPRNEDARRMTSKIKIQMGQAAFKAAQAALANHAYPEAITQAEYAIQHDYEISRSSAIKVEAEHAIRLARMPKPKIKKEPPSTVAASTTTAPAPATAAPPPPAQPANPEEAMEHYRQGIAAIRKKDFHLAMDELDAASKLDPSNERIYMARERARQEWNAANASRSTP